MSSVVVKFTDPNSIRDAVARFAGSLRSIHPEIQRIIWFGSWVKGTYTPGSDVDICIVVSETAIRARDRAVNTSRWS